MDRETRVRVWTLGGTQIGLPGVGEGDNRLTFPRHFLVGEALNAGFQHSWLRFATPGEMREDGTWYRIYEHPVRALCYANSQVAPVDEPMGLHIQNGVCRLTANAVEPPVDVQEKEAAEVSDVSTPSTPPMQD